MVRLPADSALSPAACRVPAGPGPAAPLAIAWTLPSDARDREQLDDWCEAAGSPVVLPAPAFATPSSGALAVVSWNLHAGEADLTELVRRLRQGTLTGGAPPGHFILLLQEAYRANPTRPGVGAGPPAAGASGGSSRTDIVELARALGLSLYYVPSMRSGAAADRGNAILATGRLSELAAIELPFERQRRVAVSALVSGRGRDGRPWRLRVASVHLENRGSFRGLWIGGTAGRVRQARGLLAALRLDQPLIVGGDLNTWFGFSDPAYRVVSESVPDLTADRRPTFGPLFRLDHVFSRLPRGWIALARRLDERLGSDHYPLLAQVRLPEAGTPPATTRAN